MMLQYRDLVKLRTTKVVFEDIIPARDPATLEYLKEMSSKRKVIEESINQTSSVTEAIAREMSGGSTCRWEQELLRLQQYLPMLENLISRADPFNCNRQMAYWISQLKIRWSSPLSSLAFFNLAGPKFFQIDNLWSELGMTLFLYGVVLRERALEVLPADLKKSAFIFREAAGLFHYLAHDVLPPLLPSSAERPPEAMPSVSVAMSLICLAEAQALYIRKAEEIGNTSFGVLAKLHYGVAELLSESPDTLYSGIGEGKSISSSFLEFISSCRALHELQSQKYFAKGLKYDGQVGVAIGLLREALINAKKKMPGDYSWKAVFMKEVETAENILQKLEYENEFIWHEKITSGDKLPSPQGSRIVKIEPYQPQKFGRKLSFKW